MSEHQEKVEAQLERMAIAVEQIARNVDSLTILLRGAISKPGKDAEHAIQTVPKE